MTTDGNRFVVLILLKEKGLGVVLSFQSIDIKRQWSCYMKSCMKQFFFTDRLHTWGSFILEDDTRELLEVAVPMRVSEGSASMHAKEKNLQMVQ